MVPIPVSPNGSLETGCSFLWDTGHKISWKTCLLSQVQPFAKLYKTTSDDWTTWYNSEYNKAEEFDENNIHSLENNLPQYIRENTDHNDLKRFLDTIGEHFDLIRSYIDNYGSFYNI